MSDRRLLAVLQTLAENECQFIVVGGLAAVLNGAPIQTYDIDLVYARTAENIGRLLFVLASLDAVFRMQPERRLRPAASHLSGQGHLNLLTSAGPLDLLATVGQDLTYEDLAPHSLEMNVGEGVSDQGTRSGNVNCREGGIRGRKRSGYGSPVLSPDSKRNAPRRLNS